MKEGIYQNTLPIDRKTSNEVLSPYINIITYPHDYTFENIGDHIYSLYFDYILVRTKYI